MDLMCQMEIRRNPNLAKFLRENSVYYKLLNRDGSNLLFVENKMKEIYKLRTEDKLLNLGKTISTVNEFIKILN